MEINDLEAGKFYMDNNGDILELASTRNDCFIFLRGNLNSVQCHKYIDRAFLESLTETESPIKLKGYLAFYKKGIKYLDTKASAGENDMFTHPIATIDFSTLTRANLLMKGDFVENHKLITGYNEPDYMEEYNVE